MFQNLSKKIKNTQIASLKNLKNYAIYIHGLSGACCEICADQLSKKAEELEKAANAKDFEFITANNQKYLEAIENLIINIEDVLNRIP